MTAYDNWLTQGSERPERDEQAWESAIEIVADQTDGEKFDAMLNTLYDALPALSHAIHEIVFPVEMRPYITALTNLAADIRAKVDDEYKSLTEIYDDPRD